jgi:hypothetical protein
MSGSTDRQCRSEIRQPRHTSGPFTVENPIRRPEKRPPTSRESCRFPGRLAVRRAACFRPASQPGGQFPTGAIPIAGFLSHENVARIMAAAQHTRDFDEEEDVMYVIREVVHCKPGKVRGMVEKFMSISNAMKEMGQEPLRLLTDVTGEPFWTLVAEAKVEKVDDFFAIEQKLMTNETIRKAMADYHDLVESGRREIYRVES